MAADEMWVGRFFILVTKKEHRRLYLSMQNSWGGPLGSQDTVFPVSFRCSA